MATSKQTWPSRLGAAEYTNCFSEEGLDSPKEYSGYDTKQYDGEASVLLEL